VRSSGGAGAAKRALPLPNGARRTASGCGGGGGGGGGGAPPGPPAAGVGVVEIIVGGRPRMVAWG